MGFKSNGFELDKLSDVDIEIGNCKLYVFDTSDVDETGKIPIGYELL